MLYFAYGSNMDMEQLSGRGVFPQSRRRAVLEGHSLNFNKISIENIREGKANLGSERDARVEGVLYEVADSDLSRLDRFEGVATNQYCRIHVTVRMKDGSKVQAVTYVACPERVGTGLKPTRKYLAHLLRGRDLLSPQYAESLESFETLD